MAKKKVMLALPCASAREYQLMARGLFLVLDVIGEGLPTSSVQHHAMLQLFKQEWGYLSMEERMALVNRMALAMKAGAVLEAAGDDLDTVAETVIAQHEQQTNQRRKN